LVKGIGPILAKKLVERFRAEVLVIEKRPAELQSVDGIGPKRRKRIAHAWQTVGSVPDENRTNKQARWMYRFGNLFWPTCGS
jgi:exodeoxyribonuclease V alpha subunit